ncbi:tyrosine tRNA ligase [Schizopora paradoxa]|uniref:Tyrosine--tRNA ligase n=1 Tax=Schizopora paradoxa TaxID=27342 RepID=A0A0H2RZK7_9AGAM|nr:tyrosine tRNA ligase [Schizopora paradoxa]
MDPEKRYELIVRRLQEVLGGEAIKQILADGRNPKCYWGTAPTGKPHVGYFVPLTKIADFLRADVEVTILLADVHAFLDTLKSSFELAEYLELVEYRSQYYKHVLVAVFKSLGIPTSKLHFVQGSSFQYSKEYTMDNFKMCAKVTEHDARRAGAEVVKQDENPLLSGLLYPGMQALDEVYLKCDFQFGGVDQRKIFIHAETFLPKIGYPKRAHLMNEMVPGLTAGGKMSASDPNSKIDLLDPPEVVKRKIKSAFCEEGNIEANGPLSFVKAVLIPISTLRLDRQKERAEGGNTTLEDGLGDQRTFAADDAPEGSIFTISRPEKYGGSLHYTDFKALEQDFADKKIHPGDLKSAVESALNRLLAPIRKLYEENEEWQTVAEKAYPDPNAKAPAKKKKEKKYHPPPPGKGKNADKPEEPSQPSGNEPSPQPEAS